MDIPEFIVELTKAYAMILTAVWWPLVVLIIFFAIFYRIGANSRKKRVPLTWKGLNTLFNNLERQHLASRPLNEEERRRKMIVCRELQEAKNAADQHDEKTLYKVVSSLSNVAMQNDKQLAKQHLPENQQSPYIEAPDEILQELENKKSSGSD